MVALVVDHMGVPENEKGTSFKHYVGLEDDCTCNRISDKAKSDLSHHSRTISSLNRSSFIPFFHVISCSVGSGLDKMMRSVLLLTLPSSIFSSKHHMLPAGFTALNIAFSFSSLIL